MADLLTSEDVVPAFRADLKLADPVQGAGEKLVTVADPLSGKSMAFRGFELSIARMLNGRRTATEVIDAAEAIGLPISLEGLSGFVQKLRSLGFLSHPLDAPIEQQTTWGERREWSEEVRARYQIALREARSNDLNAAKEHLLALKKDAGENKDVTDLLAWVEERLKAGASGKKLAPFADVFGVVEKGWFDEAERQSEQNAKAQAELSHKLASMSDIPVAVVPTELPAAEAEEEQAPKKGGAGKFIVILLLLVVVGGGAAAALYPIPTVIKGTYELGIKSSQNVEVAREGKVLEVAVKDGDWVEADATLFTYDAEAAKKKLEAAEKKLADVQKKAEKAGSGKKLAEAKKKLKEAQDDLKDAQGDLDKANKKGKKPAIAKAEKKVKKEEASVAKAQKAVDAAAPTASGEAKAELDKATQERDALKAQAEAAPFKAPSSGFVKGLSVKAGDAVKPGTPVCQLDDTKQLAVKVKAEGMKEGQTATLTLGGKQVPVKIEKIINGEGRGTLDNPKTELKPGDKGELSIEGATRTLLSKYL